MPKAARLVYGLGSSSLIFMKANKKIPNKFKEETQRIESEAKKQLLTYLVSAFSFIAGLAWNEAIKSIIEVMFPGGMESIYAKIIYAMCITLFVVVATIFLTRLLKEKKD